MHEISKTYYSWVARDKSGALKLFRAKPFRWKWFGEWGGELLARLNPDDFPDVTWENSPKIVEFELRLANG